MRLVGLCLANLGTSWLGCLRGQRPGDPEARELRPHEAVGLRCA